MRRRDAMADDVSNAFGVYPPIMSQMETEVGPGAGADDIQRHSLNSLSHTSHTPQTTQKYGGIACA